MYIGVYVCSTHRAAVECSGGAVEWSEAEVFTNRQTGSEVQGEQSAPAEVAVHKCQQSANLRVTAFRPSSEGSWA